MAAGRRQRCRRLAAVVLLRLCRLGRARVQQAFDRHVSCIDGLRPSQLTKLSTVPGAPHPNNVFPTGLSERALADYCISLGKRARDAGSLASMLEEQGLPPGGATRQFAADLLARLPRGGGSGAAAAAAAAQKQRDAEAAAFARKQAQYSLLLDEDDAEEEQRRRQQQEAQRQRQQQQDGGGGRDGKDGGGKKHLRRSKAELEGDDETVVKKRSRKRAWEEEEGGCVPLAGVLLGRGTGGLHRGALGKSMHGSEQRQGCRQPWLRCRAAECCMHVSVTTRASQLPQLTWPLPLPALPQRTRPRQRSGERRRSGSGTG